MEFDTADATNYFAQGLWDDIVMHELMHVVGFGTLWEYGSRDLVDGTLYVGPAGTSAYGGDIPIEQDGGSGTAGGHWDEDTLDNELMTGYIDASNYLAEYSVMSLDDLGYIVDGYVDYQDYQNALLA